MQAIDAEIIEEKGKVLIKKTCPEHGNFKDVYWSNAEMYKWAQKFASIGNSIKNPRTEKRRGCPFDCGICPNHKSHTVLAIIDVTNRCVTGDTKIVLENGSIERIEDVVEKRKTGKVLSWDKEKYVPSFESIIDWQKLEAPETLVEVTTHTGKYTFTPDHELLTDSVNGPLLKRVDKLKKGDRIYSLAELPIYSRKIDPINLLAESDFEFFIYGDYKEGLKKQLRQKFGSLRKASRMLNIKYERLINSKISLSAKDLRTLRGNGFSIEDKISKIKVHHKTYEISLPLKPDFFHLLGLIDSDGRIVAFKGEQGSTHYISFFNTSSELNNEFLRILRAYFPKQRVRRNKDRIDFTNLVLAEMVKRLWTKDARAFSRLFTLDEPSLAEFLAGYFDGDGHVTLTSSEIAFTTVNEEVAERLSYLLKRLGIVSVVQKLKFGKTAFSKMEFFYKTKVVGLGCKKKFIENIQCRHIEKKEKLHQLIGVLAECGKGSFVDSVPIHVLNFVRTLMEDEDKEITKLPDTSTLYKVAAGARGCSKGYVKKQLRTLEMNGNAGFLSDSFFLDEVVNLKIMRNHGVKYVYDITVANSPLFVMNGNLVVSNCNIRCPICFANAAAAGYVYEPTFEQIKEMFKNLRANKPTPTPSVQFSGGEPTIRDDLPDIVRAAKEAGFRHVEVNTNGTRLARDLDFAKRLHEAGVSTIYLQFDGFDPEIYKTLRGRDLLDSKFKAIENCRKVGLKSVVLVVTLVKGVNDHQLGEIIRFAIKNLDVVKCVNVQPVSFAGRISQKKRMKWRITIPDFIEAVEEQTNGQIKVSDFYPVPSVVPISNFIEAYKGKNYVEFTAHEHCGVATYVFKGKGGMIPITRFVKVERLFELLDKYAEELKRGGFGAKAKVVAKAIKNVPGTIDMRKAPEGLNLLKIIFNVLCSGEYSALAEFHEQALMIGCMHFMDVYNFDLKRVDRCLIHYATPDGRIIPFCTYNTIHRSKVERGYSIPLAEWNRPNRKG